MFCPKCGSLLRNRVNNSGKNEQYCACGYTKKLNGEQYLKEKIDHKDSEIHVREQIDPLADFDHKCAKCGYEKAFIVQKEIAKCETWTRCEPNRTEVVCGKCGFRERLE